MTITEDPWTSLAPEAAGRQLVQVPSPVLDALADGDLEAARNLSDKALTPYMIAPECGSVWKRRRAQIKGDSGDALWVTRFLVVSSTGAVVGRAGYHGKPNGDGMVEVGYSIDPLFRRQGHARAALKILLDVAKDDPRVQVVRATVRPDNIASRALIDRYRFREVGEQWDEGDGLRVILEVHVA